MKSGSGCQATGVEASAPLRLLAHVILNVEFRLVGIVAFSGLQLPETRVVDQLFSCQFFFTTRTYTIRFSFSFTEQKLPKKNMSKLD